VLRAEATPEQQETAGGEWLGPYTHTRARLGTKGGSGRAQEGEDNLNPSTSTTDSAASGWIGHTGPKPAGNLSLFTTSQPAPIEF